MDMTIRNARPADGSGLLDITIRDGRIAKIDPAGSASPRLGGSGGRLESATAVDFDAGGRLVIAPFIDPHLHLDAVLTAGNPRFNRSGTHPEGIEVWGEYKKAHPGFDDMRERVRRAVEWEAALGIRHIRTHIDICDPDLKALKLMLELREELRHLADIRIVAFPQDGILSYPGCLDLMAEALRMGADLVGGIPHCEWTREDGVASIGHIFDLAEQFDRDIDIHCDETDDPSSRFLEVVAAQTIRRGYEGRVSAGHTTAMHSYDNAYAFKLIGLLARSGVNIIANPFDNIVLMGRFDSYPKRRGITRVKELLEGGVNVCLGHDSIMDPWYPLGRGDLLEAALLAAQVCHMTGTDDIRRIFDTVTVNSAKTIGIAGDYGIREGGPADLVVLDCRSVLDAVRLSPARLLVITGGRVTARTQPEKTEIVHPDRTVEVDFLST